MRIQDVMSRNVISIPPTATVAVARETLREAEIDHLVVVEKERIAGVLSGEDIADGRGDQPVSAVMTRKVAIIEPEATLRHAAGIMRGRAVGCLPVVDHGRLIGIVTTSDLLTALAKGAIHATPAGERTILRKRGPRRKPAAV